MLSTTHMHLWSADERGVVAAGRARAKDHRAVIAGSVLGGVAVAGLIIAAGAAYAVSRRRMCAPQQGFWRFCLGFRAALIIAAARTPCRADACAEPQQGYLGLGLIYRAHSLRSRCARD